MIILAIDPGNIESAYVVIDDKYAIVNMGKVPNDEMLKIIKTLPLASHMAIEMIASYGMAVGQEVFDTCVFIGRCIEAWGPKHTRIYRKDVKLALCQSPRAKDANIRQALIDRLGPQGTKKNPGPTYGVKADIWSALAVGVYQIDQMKAKPTGM